MEIKVKAVGDAEEKSIQQVEQELLDKHQENSGSEVSVETNVETTNTVEAPDTKTETPELKEEIETQSSELKEEDVLKFMESRYGREINSLDELNQTRKEDEPLPEDVSKYLQFKKETGRGFDDFAKMQKNYDEMEPDRLLREYLTATEKGLDAEDITDLMEDYQYDEDIDDEKQIRKIKLAKKKTIAKAKDFFEKQQELYKVPLESSGNSNPEAESEDYKAYKQYIAEAKTVEERNSRAREVYLQKTNNVFTEFKGFEFKMGDTSLTYSPGSPDELKKLQSTPYNFINRFIGPDGLLKDATGYHRALAIAMNPEKFAQFFYEQGKSSGTEDVMRKTKNINMSERKSPEVTSKGGMQIRSLSNNSGKGLKIKSLKRK